MIEYTLIQQNLNAADCGEGYTILHVHDLDPVTYRSTTRPTFRPLIASFIESLWLITDAKAPLLAVPAVCPRRKTACRSASPCVGGSSVPVIVVAVVRFSPPPGFARRAFVLSLRFAALTEAFWPDERDVHTARMEVALKGGGGRGKRS